MTKIFLFTLFFPGLLWANSSQDAMTHFEQAISQYVHNCDGGCPIPFIEKVLFDGDEHTEDAHFFQIKDSLLKVSFDQVQVWGDTILEGDYIALGEISLDNVVAIYKGSHLIGYHVIYSQKAWETGSCDFDGEDESTLKNCVSGRISEGSYVSPDFRLYFRDENQYAEFSED